MSNDWQKRAESVLAQGCLTYSKSAQCYVKGVFPTHLVEGHDCYVTDTEGKTYVDFMGGLGSNLLDCTNNLSLPTIYEVELAEKIRERVPVCEKLRILKTGSCATQAAVRIARAYKQNGRTYEDLQNMWEREAIFRISQKTQCEGWASSGVQGVCQRLSIESSRNGNKAIGTEEICKNSEGNCSGAQTQSQKTSKMLASGAAYCLLQVSNANRKRDFCSRALRNLWEESTGSSSELQRTAQCGMAMPHASCPSSHGYGLGNGYHGGHNWSIATEHPGMGCIDEKYIKLNTIDGICKFIRWAKSLIDYVIVEPVQLDLNVKGQLQELRALCTKNGIVLIFDEVITGFRTPQYCMANYLGVQPDIICLGKALGNGYPLAIVGGKKEFMDTPGWFVSSTFAGEMSSIKQALKVIDILHPEMLDLLWQRGGWFQKKFNELSPKLQLKGIPTKAVFVGDELTKNLFWQEMCKRGFLTFKAWHITFSHTEKVILDTLNIAKHVLKDIENGKVQLEGALATEVFRRYEDKNEQKNA